MHRCSKEIVILVLYQVTILCSHDSSPVSLYFCVLLVHIDVLGSDSIGHQSCALKVEVLVSFDFGHGGYFG